MGLSTDSIFIDALKSNAELLTTLGQKDGKPARLYGTAIALPDDDAENVPVPYVIVTFDGLTNMNQTKDDEYESNYDQVQIGVECAAATLKDLHVLTQSVRQTILSYMRRHYELGNAEVENYLLTADAIQYDSLKPCYWQTLRYQCDVNNSALDDDE